MKSHNRKKPHLELMKSHNRRACHPIENSLICVDHVLNSHGQFLFINEKLDCNHGQDRKGIK